MRTYTHAGAASEKFPVGVFIHGGDDNSGPLDSEDPQRRIITQQTPSIIASVDYCFAPTHKLRVLLKDDCLTASERVVTTYNHRHQKPRPKGRETH